MRIYYGIVLTFMVCAAGVISRAQDHAAEADFFGPIVFQDHAHDIYRQYYPFNAGDVFTHEKHQHGIEKIETALHDHGYWGAKIADEVVAHGRERAITIDIHTGPQYLIGQVALQSRDSDNQFFDAVISKIRKALVHKRYHRDLLDAAMARIKKDCLYAGYCQALINDQVILDAKNLRVSVLFSLQLGPRTVYTFEGNKFFTHEQIFDTIFSGQSFWLLPESVLQQELLDAYYQHGFWHSSITVQHVGDRTHFSIKEGDRVRIKRVIIEGALQYTCNTLVAQCFKLVLKNRFFDEASIDGALQKLLLFYTRNGFWDIAILDKQYMQHEKNSFYDVRITIDEGAQYFLEKVLVWNYPKINTLWPFRIAGKPIPFDKDLLYEQYYWLNSYCADHGETLITSYPVIDECGPHRYAVSWHLECEKEPIKFGATTLITTGKLSNAYIVRELVYTQGHPWDLQKIDDSIQRLRQLGIFKTVDYTTTVSETDAKSRNITITMQEDDPFEVRARFGVQQVSKNPSFDTGTSFKAGGAFIWKNPLNQAGIFLVDADFTRFDRTILAEYTVPWIFGKRIAMHMRGYSNRQNNPPFVEVGATLYQAKRDGIGVEWEYNAGLLRFGLSTGFEWQGIFDGMNSGCDIAKALDFDRDLMNKRFLYFVCAPHCQIRWLDDPVDPHAGFITFFSVKGMLNNDNKERLSFVKLLAEQTVFIPIIDPVVLALRMRVGHITSNFYRTILPSERFFLGGPSTIRGYEPDFVPPLGECLEEDICIPQGGKTMLNGNIEVRFPLNKWMQGVIFNDFGFLCKDACFDDKLLGATGAGLRLKSPLGIVRFDIGWKWRREIDQTPLAWYLTVGHAF